VTRSKGDGKHQKGLAIGKAIRSGDESSGRSVRRELVGGGHLKGQDCALLNLVTLGDGKRNAVGTRKQR